MTPTHRLLSIAITLAVAGLIYLLVGGRHSHPLIKMIVLVRFAALFSLFSFVAALAGLGAFPTLTSLVQNVFILDNGWQLCHVTWMSLLLGTAILVTTRTTKINAPRRFTDLKAAIRLYTAQTNRAIRLGLTGQSALGRLRHHVLFTMLHHQKPGSNFWHKRWVYLAVFSLPIPLSALLLTFVDFERTGSAPAAILIWLGGGFVGGIIIWVAAMLATTLLQQLFLDQPALDVGLFPFDRLRLINSSRRLTLLDGSFHYLARKVSRLGPGYAEEDPATHRWRWRPGHGQLAIFVAVLSLGYFVALVFWDVPRPNSWYSALFGLLTMMLSGCVLTTGAAFLLDYFRIPLVPTLLTVSLFTWWVSGADSYYEVKESPTSRPLTLQEVDFTKTKQPKKTLVVVTAAGGGIQAAAWTAQVLTGLEEIYGKELRDSIGVVSSVSGGSVGAMFFLDRWDHLASADARQKIRESAMDSSLEATAWGWSGWDTVEMLAPFLVPNFRDRGWAIENSWRRDLAHPDDSLGTWVNKARDGFFPIVVFNATASDDGKRFVMSNVSIPEPSDRDRQGGEAVKAVEFFKSCNGFDLPVATAARLSATFPYVSPICRPSANVEKRYHLADGGYVDNEGMVSALEWLRHLVRLRATKPAGASFERVLIVRIVPFPPEAQEETLSRLGWLEMISGPINTVMNVRTTSQVERNQIALELSKEILEAGEGQPKLRVATFQFRYTEGNRKDPPLSWRLSRAQKTMVQSAWQAITCERMKDDNPLRIMDDWFTPKP